MQLQHSQVQANEIEVSDASAQAIGGNRHINNWFTR